MNISPWTEKLIECARSGDLEGVVQCTDNGADPKFWNSQALSEAAIHNHLDVVKHLTPLSDVNANTAVALRNAFLHNNTDIINFLWDQVDHELIIEQTQFVPRTAPFQLACQYGFYQHAMSLLKYPLHQDMIWKSMFHLPKVSNDPLCLKLWDELLTRVKDLGEDPAQWALATWHERPLPGLNILKIMAQHSASSPKSAQRFLKYLAQNWFTENHIIEVFPILGHVFEDLDNDVKQMIVAKSVAHDPVFARALIDRCHNTQLLCAPVVEHALHADMDTLMYMVSVWQKRTYRDNAREFEKLETALIERICDAPEKVWCIVEKFTQFLTPKVAHIFIWCQEDEWTARVCAVFSPECLQEAQTLFNDQTREYFNEYQNRIQNAKLKKEVSDCTGLTVTRKI